jgi:hypothetical protein
VWTGSVGILYDVFVPVVPYPKRVREAQGQQRRGGELVLFAHGVNTEVSEQASHLLDVVADRLDWVVCCAD